jgi:murein DD-endopeptidase MepM/ murein hydrolase activator NlpD
VIPVCVIALFLASCGGAGSSNSNAVDCSVYPAQASSPYVLPYPVGTSHVAVTTTAHAADHRYAIDFAMPIGSTITAARNGRVYKVEASFFDTDHLEDQANYVFVLHDDNTLGLYGHLTHNGALVNKGDLVTTGEPLGLSGDSGLSTQPHLHFEVVRCTVTAWTNESDCPPASTVSVPTVFRNSVPTACGLQVGTAYTAEPY